MGGDALQLVRAEVLEPHVRAGHQISHGARHQHLAGAGLRHHAGTDVDRDPADLRPDHLDLAHVDAGPHLDAEALNVANHRLGAPDGLGGLVERGEEPIAGRVDLPPLEPLELPPHQRVVRARDLPPPLVTDLHCLVGRAHDVGEQHGGEQALGGFGSPRHGRSLGPRPGTGKGEAEKGAT